MAKRTNPFSNLTTDLPNIDFSKIEMPKDLDELEKEINARFDDFQSGLPAPLDAMFSLQRSLFNTTYGMTKSAAKQMNAANSSMMKQAQDSAQRFIDTFQKQVNVVQKQATKAAKDSDKPSEGKNSQAKAKADKPAAKPAKEDEPATDYASWTKDELYHEAQALDIEGRSSMSKDELVQAVSAAKS